MFTTNYDLLLYWASLAKPPFPFKDGFWNTDGDPAYQIFDTVPPEGSDTRFIYFLNGALHLYSAGGDVRKIVWGSANLPLIDQIREALSEDDFRPPLVVSEGASRHKEKRIGGNGYLSGCRGNFQAIDGTLFVFGSSLGEEDRHILRWIGLNRKLRRLFVSVHGDPQGNRNTAMISRIVDQVRPRSYSSTIAAVPMYGALGVLRNDFLSERLNSGDHRSLENAPPFRSRSFESPLSEVMVKTGMRKVGKLNFQSGLSEVDQSTYLPVGHFREVLRDHLLNRIQKILRDGDFIPTWSP